MRSRYRRRDRGTAGQWDGLIAGTSLFVLIGLLIAGTVGAIAVPRSR
ncbi:MAG: hypothetical protein QOH59_1553, partial [Gemmatimonadales bacterium]|nr:hypothetical protein [Gemmatimonadales bacterium]